MLCRALALHVQDWMLHIAFVGVMRYNLNIYQVMVHNFINITSTNLDNLDSFLAIWWLELA